MKLVHLINSTDFENINLGLKLLKQTDFFNWIRGIEDYDVGLNKIGLGKISSGKFHVSSDLNGNIIFKFSFEGNKFFIYAYELASYVEKYENQRFA